MIHEKEWLNVKQWKQVSSKTDPTSITSPTWVLVGGGVRYKMEQKNNMSMGCEAEGKNLSDDTKLTTL